MQLLRTLSEKSSDYLEMKSDSSSIMPSMFSWAKIDYNNSDGKTTCKEELEEEELGEDILIEACPPRARARCQPPPATCICVVG